MKRLVDIPPKNLKGLRVLVRSELNAPMGDALVRNDFRMRKATKTTGDLRVHGPKVVIGALVGRDPKDSLEPISRSMKPLLPHVFIKDIVGREAHMAADAMKAGDVILLENVRQHPGETTNDSAFAQELANFADLYVNDAFSVSHREHASIVGVPRYIPGYAGFLFADEFDNLSDALNPTSPSLVIVGGAKFETKEPLIKKLLNIYDAVFIGGAIANDLLKARGFPIGRSVISTGVPGADVMNHPHLIIPSDVTVENEQHQARVKKASDVTPGDKIVDIGPDSFAEVAHIIRTAKFVLWNGPTGLYEDGYDEWTEVVAHAIAGSSARTVVGGGDTIATIDSLGIEEKFTFLSTAGGALLEFLTNGTLPGIKML